MKLIREEELNTSTVIEEGTDGKKNFFIEGIYLQGNIKNGNGRMYPTPVLDRAVSIYEASHIKTNRAFGELSHPKGPQINLDKVSHRIVELRKDGDNYIGKSIILDTVPGRTARGIMEGGGQLAVSSRGLGTLRESNGVSVVQDDFYLATAADIVADPSAPSAFVNGIMEHKEWVWENGVLSEQEIKTIKNDLDKDSKKTHMDIVEAEIKAFETFMKAITKT